MLIFNEISVIGGIGYGTCIRFSEFSEEKEDIESIEEQCSRLETLRNKVFTTNNSCKIINAIDRLWQDMLQEMMERSRSGEFSSAEVAVKCVSEELMDMLSNSRNGNLNSRLQEILDIKNEMLASLQKETNGEALCNKNILVADRISVFNAIDAVKKGVAAILVKNLSLLSHAYFIIRGGRIPIAFGFNNLDMFLNGAPVLVDGPNKRVILDPNNESIVSILDLNTKKPPIQAFFHLEDGSEFQICANCCGSWEDVSHQIDIGLLRTEYFYEYLCRLPLEGELFSEYFAIVCPERSTTIRLLDAGVDKPIPGLSQKSDSGELYFQKGIRLLLNNPEILKTQLRAIMRAAIYGKIRILIPMVTQLEELLAIRNYMHECSIELTIMGKKHRNDIAIGVMIETPSAAIMADMFAKEADFASIGTNDLMQYVMLSPREIEDAPEPKDAVLRLIEYCVKCFNYEEKPISVCGESVLNSRWLQELIRIGIRNVSVPYESIETIMNEIGVL